MCDLSQTMVQAVENERKRLSRALHDGFLQSLVAAPGETHAPPGGG